MSCICNENFCIKNEKASIHFITIVPELLRKCKLVFKDINNLRLKENICTIDVNDARDFFEKNLEFIDENFTLFEQNEIKVFVETSCEILSISSVLKAKPLNIYLNFIKDNSFFEILESESLTTHFQPIIDVQSSSIYAYECLTRGVLPNGDLMYPNDLFEKSSRNDTNFRLDKLCRESALKTAAVKKINSKVFINFLPTAIYDPKFCLQSTVRWANQLELDPRNIIFEVVETENVEDKVHLKQILNYYREQGFKIALDDVGEGYSSLNMIIDIKPDIIKVDRNIIDGIDKNELKQSVYKALKSICVENHIQILAEGIETQEELSMVKKLGVDFAQGYYFAKPSPEPVRRIF
ncbi:EAL domain-containing protein [Arcobacter sp. YIC-464]|uniref:EAL domain-containing protein n=1 Tax=Arcobacter sp. YIC-464 TaxID=3376631 RepID=UPI003C163956